MRTLVNIITQVFYWRNMPFIIKDKNKNKGEEEDKDKGKEEVEEREELVKL